MTVSSRTRAPEGDPFEFTAENRKWANAQIKKYPAGRGGSAVIPLLMRAQEQNGGHLTRQAIEYVAEYLDIPKMRAMEVASFYTMFHLKPMGEHVIEICRTTPCWLRGSDDILAVCEEELGITIGETTEDGRFSLVEMECMGACVNAPMCSIHKRYYEDLGKESMKEILRALKDGEIPKPGPRVHRHKSAPAGGPTALQNQVKTNAE